MLVLYRSLHWAVAIICGAMAAMMGAISGKEPGAALGAFNGLAVGYAYVHFALRVKGTGLAKLLTRGAYGSIAGLVSGGLVHVPGILLGNSIGNAEFIPLGAVAGLVIGTIFGLLLAVLLAALPEPPEEGPGAPADPKNP